MNSGIQILRKDLFSFFCLVLVTAMFGSKFMLSVSMISLIALSLIDLDLYPFRLRLSWDFFNAWKDLFKHKNFLALSLIFWMPVISIFWSVDLGEWFGRNKMHIPFLGLAIAFLGMKSWSIKTYDFVLKYTVGISLFSALLVLYYYFNTESNSLQSISKGQSMWMPINHIRYSLILAYATVLSFYFILKFKDQTKIALFWLVCGLFLFFFVHFIAVRSGIIALYINLFIWGIIILFKKKKKVTAIFFMVSILVVPMLAVKYIPTLRNKVNYMKWDLQQFSEGTKSISSDNRRLQSLVGGWEVFKKSPIIGVGIGDLEDEMQQYYKENSVDFAYFPHNQYLFILAGTGIIGLIIFLYSMLFPLFYQSAYLLPPLLTIQVIALVSFFVENTLENALGVAIFSFYIIMGLRSLMEIRKSHQSI